MDPYGHIWPKKVYNLWLLFDNSIYKDYINIQADTISSDK